MKHQLKKLEIPEDEYDRQVQVQKWIDWWVDHLNKYDLHYIEAAFVQGEKNRQVMPDFGYPEEVTTLSDRLQSHADHQEFEFGIEGGISSRESKEAAEYALTLFKIREWTF